MITIKSEYELSLMRIAGRIVYDTHKYIKDYIKPGITTGELDKLAHDYIISRDATPSCLGYEGYPASICISVNEEVVHGIPGKRKLKNGDIVTLDICACYKGYHGDSAWTYPVGEINSEKKYLLEHTEKALYEGLSKVKAGVHLVDVSNAIEENAIEENDVRESAVRENAVNKGSELETDFADEQELQEALEEENTAQEKFFQRIKNWAEEKKMKYNIYKCIMLFVVNVFLLPYLQENVGKPVMTKVVSCVKQAPEKGAEIICRLKDGIQAIITENTNYYYKVKFTDENGVEREGYVAKKNLRVIEEEEGETEQENDKE